MPMLVMLAKDIVLVSGRQFSRRLFFQKLPLTDYAHMLYKKKNGDVVFRIPGTFWTSASAREGRKIFSTTAVCWDPAYQWKGKSTGGSMMLVGEKECFIGETQYKTYAPSLAESTTIAQQRKEEQAALGAPTAIELHR